MKIWGSVLLGVVAALMSFIQIVEIDLVLWGLSINKYPVWSGLFFAYLQASPFLVFGMTVVMATITTATVIRHRNRG